jgi:hypothetical protein
MLVHFLRSRSALGRLSHRSSRSLTYWFACCVPVRPWRASLTTPRRSLIYRFACFVPVRPWRASLTTPRRSLCSSLLVA